MYRRRIVNLMVHRCAHGSGSSAAVLLAAMACALVLALAGCGRSSGTGGGAVARDAPTYTLLQMNLCLSGRAGCYAEVAYPAGVEDAVALIREARPDAVTLNEVCRSDVARIARRT